MIIPFYFFHFFFLFHFTTATNVTINVNAGSSPEDFVRAIYPLIYGSTPVAGFVVLWATQLRTVSTVRRVDIIRQMCLINNVNCLLTYPPPDVTYTRYVFPYHDCGVNPIPKRLVGALFVFSYHCPNDPNCNLDVVNTHPYGMQDPDSSLGYGKYAEGYYDSTNPGFWLHEYEDAVFAGLSYFSLNVFGPELLPPNTEITALNQILFTNDIYPQGNGSVKISLYDNTDGWGNGPAPFDVIPNLCDTENTSQLLYTSKWKPFYTLINTSHWFRINLTRPFIHFYDSGKLRPLTCSSAVISRMKQLFFNDFNVYPFVVVDSAFFGDPNMTGAADSEFVHDPLRDSLNGKYRSTMNGLKIDTVMPRWDSFSYEHPGAIPNSTTDAILKGTDLLSFVLNGTTDGDVLTIMTWNNLTAGTGINRRYDSYDYCHGGYLDSAYYLNAIKASQLGCDSVGSLWTPGQTITVYALTPSFVYEELYFAWWDVAANTSFPDPLGDGAVNSDNSAYNSDLGWFVYQYHASIFGNIHWEFIITNGNTTGSVVEWKKGGTENFVITQSGTYVWQNNTLTQVGVSPISNDRRQCAGSIYKPPTVTPTLRKSSSTPPSLFFSPLLFCSLLFLSSLLSSSS